MPKSALFSANRDDEIDLAPDGMYQAISGRRGRPMYLP
jgi:hypothetical protein